MARSSRMFEIIQLLRVAKGPCTAQWLADELEVTKRTIYRDIASLQAMRVPIEGEAGVGYVMRAGFDLPPINFDVEEAEAITVGLLMIARTGDHGLERAGRRAARKLSDATPLSETLFSSSWGPEAPVGIDLSDIRNAIRQTQLIKIDYLDDAGASTTRSILPLAVIYYAESIVLAAWCNLRQDFRHFRPDRIASYTVGPETFADRAKALRQDWAKDHASNL